MQAYGKVFRDAKASAVSVNLDPKTGGSGYDDLREVVEEQKRMVGRAPGKKEEEDEEGWWM